MTPVTDEEIQKFQADLQAMMIEHHDTQKKSPLAQQSKACCLG
jgi:hypothetical protein